MSQHTAGIRWGIRFMLIVMAGGLLAGIAIVVGVVL